MHIIANEMTRMHAMQKVERKCKSNWTCLHNNLVSLSSCVASTLTFFFTVTLASAAKCKSMSSEVKQFVCCFCFRFEIFMTKRNVDGVERSRVLNACRENVADISDQRFNGSIMQAIKLSAKRLLSGCCLNSNDFLMTCLGIHHRDQKFGFYGADISSILIHFLFSWTSSRIMRVPSEYSMTIRRYLFMQILSTKRTDSLILPEIHSYRLSHGLLLGRNIL